MYRDSRKRQTHIDAPPLLRYNDAMKWTQRIVGGVIALIVLLAVQLISATGIEGRP